MMHYLLYPGADPVFHIRGVNCSAFSLFPLLSIPSLLLSSLFPPLSFHLFSLFCPPTFTPFPSSSLNPGEALPNQIRGSGKHYEPPAGPGGARPTNGFWCSELKTRGSAIAEEPRDALCQLKYYGRFLTELLTRSSANPEEPCEHTVS